MSLNFLHDAFIACVLVAGAMTLGGMAFAAQGRADTGLLNGQLRPCPGTPNCVSSEDGNPKARIAPLAFSGDPQAAWARARRAVEAIGGTIREASDTYLRATFTSRIFRFTDDLELRLDAPRSVIQVRSAARVGYFDFGVNRRRVERLRAAFSAPR